MSGFVLDASMTLAWYFRDEATAQTRAAAAWSDERKIVVPAHWMTEVANGMLVGERRKRSTSEETARFVERLTLLDVEIDTLAPDDVASHILPLARAHRLTVYDRLYLELAERRGLPLASLDDDLNDAARRVGVALVHEAA